MNRSEYRTDEVEIIRKCEMLSFVHALLTDPKNVRVILREVDGEKRGLTRYSRVNRKWLYKRLQKATAFQGNTSRGRKSKYPLERKEKDWRRYESVYEGDGKTINDWLRYRFESNKRHRGIVGNWLLTDDEVEALFNKVVRFKGKSVPLRTLGNQIMLKRIDSKKDVTLDNITILYRRRRKRIGKKGPEGMKKKKLLCKPSLVIDK